MRKVIPLLAILLILILGLALWGCSKKEDPVKPPPPCEITMVTPGDLEGEYYYTGDDINIRWDKTTGGNVLIELYKADALVDTIANEIANSSGYYPWFDCTTFGMDSGEDYSIKVTHLSESGCGDQTNLFELIDISECFIQFPWTSKDTIPDQTAGDVFRIIWDHGHTTGFVNLDLWYEPFAGQGDFVAHIEENLEFEVDNEGKGYYDWTVDSYHQGTQWGYRFRIKDADPNVSRCVDRSERFKITDDEICTIEVLNIPEGAIYLVGQTVPISFTFENMSGVVRLELWSANIKVNGGNIVESFDTQNGTAEYNWIVEYYQHNGPVWDRFNVRAFDVDDEYCVGVSSEFAITQ